jgi:hypothetical protein
MQRSAVGMGLSVVTAAHSCATGQTGSCAFGAGSILLGGLGYGAQRVSENLGRAADAAPFIKKMLLRGSAKFAIGYSYVANGGLVDIQRRQ